MLFDLHAQSTRIGAVTGAADAGGRSWDLQDTSECATTALQGKREVPGGGATPSRITLSNDHDAHSSGQSPKEGSAPGEAPGGLGGAVGGSVGLGGSEGGERMGVREKVVRSISR